MVAAPQPAVAQIVEQPTVAPAPTPQPISVQVPTVEKEPEPQVMPQQVVQSAAQSAPQPKPFARPVVETKVGGVSQLKGSSILGGSLSGLIKEMSNPVEGEGKSAQIVIDEASEEKMLQVKSDIVARMCKERPRFVSAFENIEFEGNVVKLAVPSEALRDELLGERFWILKSISEMAKVNGALDMKIEIKEIDFKLKPIKLEDRVDHIRKVMPEFDYMQKVFDMDVE